jgi:cytochrome oxidase Cu insertion factor (SCO1/SenC/PrrC family)
MPAKARAHIEYVLVTIDPDHDDAAALQEFRARMALDPKRWLLLRGNARDTQELAAVLGFNSAASVRDPMTRADRPC